MHICNLLIYFIFIKINILCYIILYYNYSNEYFKVKSVKEKKFFFHSFIFMKKQKLNISGVKNKIYRNIVIRGREKHQNIIKDISFFENMQ